MRAKFLQLHHVECESDIPIKSCHRFMQAVQRGIVLTWKEQGVLEDEVCAAVLERMGEL